MVAKGVSPGLGGCRRRVRMREMRRMRRMRREEGWVFGWWKRRRLEDGDRRIRRRQLGGDGGKGGWGRGGDRFRTTVRRGRT